MHLNIPLPFTIYATHTPRFILRLPCLLPPLPVPAHCPLPTPAFVIPAFPSLCLGLVLVLYMCLGCVCHPPLCPFNFPFTYHTQFPCPTCLPPSWPLLPLNIPTFVVYTYLALHVAILCVFPHCLPSDRTTCLYTPPQCLPATTWFFYLPPTFLPTCLCTHTLPHTSYRVLPLPCPHIPALPTHTPTHPTTLPGMSSHLPPPTTCLT